MRGEKGREVCKCTTPGGQGSAEQSNRWVASSQTNEERGDETRGEKKSGVACRAQSVGLLSKGAGGPGELDPPPTQPHA